MSQLFWKKILQVLRWLLMTSHQGMWSATMRKKSLVLDYEGVQFYSTLLCFSWKGDTKLQYSFITDSNTRFCVMWKKVWWTRSKQFKPVNQLSRLYFFVFYYNLIIYLLMALHSHSQLYSFSLLHYRFYIQNEKHH